MRGIQFVILSAIVLSGCHKQEVLTGPHFNLDNLPSQSVQAPTTVTITDARPGWERRAFKGTFSLVPMEDLTPLPMELLQTEIERRACDLADPPSKTRLEVQSFRVVINTESSFLYRACSSDDRDYSFPSSGLGGGFGGGGWEGAACLAVYGGVIVAVVAGACAYSAITEFIEFIQDQRHAHSRPKEMTGDYARGVSCDVHVAFVTEWPDGRRSDFQIRELVNHVEHEPERGAPYTTHDAVRDSVREACAQLARDWHEKLLHPDREVGTGKPVPVFSAYSGN